MKNDKEMLTWLYERLVNVHGENENYDYMIKFKDIIDRMVMETKITWRINQNRHSN